MPAAHDLDPPSMTEEERLAKRRYEAHFAFEMNHPPVSRATLVDPRAFPLESGRARTASFQRGLRTDPRRSLRTNENMRGYRAQLQQQQGNWLRQYGSYR